MKKGGWTLRRLSLSAAKDNICLRDQVAEDACRMTTKLHFSGHTKVGAIYCACKVPLSK